MPRKRRRRDWTLQEQLVSGPVDLAFLALVLLLTGIGLVALYSSSFASAYYETKGRDPAKYFKNQLIMAAIGVFIMWASSHFDYHWLKKIALPFYLGSAGLLGMVLIPGLGVVRNGARRWLRLPGVQFQPSELGKLAVVVLLAALMSRREPIVKPHTWNRNMWLGRRLNAIERSGIREILVYVLCLGVIAGLVLLEPHMSGAIVILATGAAVLWAAGIHLGWFAAGAVVASGAVWFIINNVSYMIRRINIQKDPWGTIDDGGWQVVQSLYAIGSGGLLGKGFGRSMQKFLYLPEESNDYIFSIWCEEMGFIGAVVVILLFVLLILRGYWIAIHARDKFGALLVVGCISLVAIQTALNIAVVTNVFPPTGISLPFFSSGGTALVMQLWEMGIVLSVSRQIEAPKEG